MGQNAGAKASSVLDCVITNALIVDYTGIYKVRGHHTINLIIGTKISLGRCWHYWYLHIRYRKGWKSRHYGGRFSKHDCWRWYVTNI